jgi:uncharacterized protein
VPGASGLLRLLHRAAQGLHEIVNRLFIGKCASASRSPWIWFGASLLVCLPAAKLASTVRLDTNLIRLLPKSSPAAKWTRALEDVVSDGGYFSIVFEGEDRARLLLAVRAAADRIEQLPETATVEYTYPRRFLEAYRYRLIPEYYLREALDEIIRWQAELSPVGVALLGSDAAPGGRPSGAPDRAELEEKIRELGHITDFHESDDGRVMGLIVRPRRGVSSFGDIRQLFQGLSGIAEETGRAQGVWAGVGGSLRNKISEYDLITKDLSTSGTISAVLIVLFLVASFRTIGVIPFLLYPVALGLIVTYAFVPALVGSLNTITAFLLLVLFGTGVENPIHLMKRFQFELRTRAPDAALRETFTSTGPSVIISGLTTAVPLFLLTVSDFRGFSEFGLIAGTGIIVMMVVLLLIMPACLILGHRYRLIRPTSESAQWAILPPPWVSAGSALLVAAAAGAIFFLLRFDYDFSNLKATVAESTAVKERHRKVYRSSLSPAALYVARDADALDRFLAVLAEARRKPGSTFGRITSIRDYAPAPAPAAERLDLISQIQDELSGSWVRRIEDPRSREWIDDIKRWAPPEHSPRIEELPAPLQRSYEARDGSGKFIVGIYPNVERKHGKNSMAFTRELYALPLPAGVQGPSGETPLFAEILWVVLGEGPWLVLLTVAGLVLLILASTRSLRVTAVIVLPLVSGVVLGLGVMSVSGLKLNFFNVVVIPTLLGMGVDFGVHYYRRWEELGGDLHETQRELLEPLTTVTISAILGYSGMIFASHPGLRSIGIAASLGLMGNLLTYTTLVPGMLRIHKRRRYPEGGP